MRVRSFGFVVLLVAGVAPLSGFGYLALERAREASVAEVRKGNGAVATAVAERVGAYLDFQRRQIGTMGAAAVVSQDAGRVIEALVLDNPSVQTARLEPSAQPSRELSAVRPSARGMGHVVIITEPVVAAGRESGVIVAGVDLVGIWPAINAIRLGETGFVRLLSGDGQLLAHGDPEERRHVFNPDVDKDRALVAAARAGEIGINQSGRRVVASVADVPGTDWIVVVEQAESEAFAGARTLTRDLLIFGAGALILLAALGLVMGRRIVRPLERLRAHVEVLGYGELERRIDPHTSLVEMRELASGLDEMARSLLALQEEAKRRERLTTFARIAAGLAHDLRIPIESVRAACDAALAMPDGRGLEMIEIIHRRDLPRLKEFVDDLRMLSRRDIGSLEVDRFDAGELVDELVAELSGYPKWKGVEFVGVGPKTVLVANRKLVRRALFNLASNGADACLEQGPGGRVEITVRGGPEGISFGVADTGPGIAADRIDALLSGDFASTKRSTGIGLGLGVARHVAELHAGHLGVESEIGRGATFVLALPGAEPTSELKGTDYGVQATREGRA